jgi:UDP:flavonoid glycosyltransferase YjiC (YdhE family)
MRVLCRHDSRGGVERLVALAVRLRALGAEAQVCAPPDCAERLAEVGVPLVPVGQRVRRLGTENRWRVWPKVPLANASTLAGFTENTRAAPPPRSCRKPPSCTS